MVSERLFRATVGGAALLLLGRRVDVDGNGGNGGDEAALDGGGAFVEFVYGMRESDELAAEAAELGVVRASGGDDVLELGDRQRHLRGVAAPGAVQFGHLALQRALSSFQRREPHHHVRHGLAHLVHLRRHLRALVAGKVVGRRREHLLRSAAPRLFSRPTPVVLRELQRRRAAGGAVVVVVSSTRRVVVFLCGGSRDERLQI
mmetsp:Transcript_20168/g.62363  ORF Transcript_20168/g.62363 Transcript_20168/m.62363 type:complete len:203 (+) Transcript_20168:460-1068(+)